MMAKVRRRATDSTKVAMLARAHYHEHLRACQDIGKLLRCSRTLSAVPHAGCLAQIACARGLWLESARSSW